VQLIEKVLLSFLVRLRVRFDPLDPMSSPGSVERPLTLPPVRTAAAAMYVCVCGRGREYDFVVVTNCDKFVFYFIYFF